MKIISRRKSILTVILAAILCFSITACSKKKDESSEFSDVEAGNYVGGKSIKVPLIAWGADLITINANGRSGKTLKGSLFDQEGLNIELFREDDFRKQTEMFISGKIAYLRGTMGMVNMASERLNANPGTRPVVIFQHSWSAGGDALVVKSGIKSVSDLKGKTVAIQNYGPHVDYFLKLLKDANIKSSDINIQWTKDFIGPEGDTPMAKLYQGNVDAAFVIIPDALALTSNGTVGTGSEDSVKGAKILLSTKTANRIISDVYAVRKDYYDKNKKEVHKFVKAMLRSEEQVRDLFANKESSEYKSLLSVGGKLLLDDPGATSDVEGMYYDAEIAGYDGNIKFLTDGNYPRNCSRLSLEIQDLLIELGKINRKSNIQIASLDYNDLKKGLKYANAAPTSKFNVKKITRIAEKLSRKGDSSLFKFEIYFKPNQNTFSIANYSDEFRKVIDFSSTYGGAIITIEGHSDTMSYLRKKKEGSSDIILKKVKQSAKNLSYSRASSVREEIIRYASSKGITLDKNQFTIIGHGISSPRYEVPQSKEEWRKNMRVQFKIIQVEAEEDVFKPL